MTDKSRNLVCFGEVILRLAVPPGSFPLQVPQMDVHVGGAEANVAVALAALGHRSRMISALPDDAIGEAAVSELRRHGVDVAGIARGAGRMGLYYHLAGGAGQAAEVIYDRSDTLFAATAADDWNWADLFDGADWLHVSGVTPALGSDAAKAVLAAVRFAREQGIGVSFDGNWRGRLWQKWNSDPAAILCEIIEQATLLFGNHRDATLLLGRQFSGDGTGRRREAALALLERFPNLDYVASTARHVVGTGEHHIVARMDSRDDSATTDPVVITPIVDRVGTGDAFAAGVLDGLWQGEGLNAVQRGLALSRLKHGLRGDFAPFGRSAVVQASQDALDVQR